MKKICKFCDKEFESRYEEACFCSRSCAAKYGGQIKRKANLENWLKTGELDYKKNTMIKVNSVYREYIENEQNHKCAICGIPDVWNDKHLVFVLDHIDGNANNHCRDNLRLVCPNCDSQLDTYKAKNKNSTRDYRVFKDKND